MTEILTKVTTFIVTLIQENKVIKQMNSILMVRLIKSQYHSHTTEIYHFLFKSYYQSEQ